MIHHSIWLWIIFIILVLVLLILDIGVFHKEKKEISFKQSLYYSLFYFVIALCFSVFIYFKIGANGTKEYLTGYLIEKTLALDNIFVISMVFQYFAIPRIYQHRVLFWGILGVIVLRAILIGVGATLVHEFEWIMYIFGLFLLVTGIKMVLIKEQTFDLNNNFILKFIKKHFKVTETLHEEKFFVKIKENKGKAVYYCTPLFVCLVIIEVIDLVFAIDSVPAIFAITNDPYIVYTSNIFAILGLRTLYFTLAEMVHRFKYLKYSLSALLIFIGGKILLSEFIGKIPASISLIVTVVVLLLGILYSIYKTNSKEVKK
ncbi:MAG: TerC/Alx family metal homeostasis membrane protein [Sphingobacteriia bacterium]|nr:TerC/Alx family metal homeostasis membrane protein [Sphingobacteriia bacterium]